MSLSMQALDFYDDLTRAQLKTISESAPDFVKTASISTKEQIADLPEELFALSALTKEGAKLLKYPINSAGDTWLSCAYFEKNAHKLPLTAAGIAATHLKTACVKFKIEVPETISKISFSEVKTNKYTEESDMNKTASARPLEERPSSGSYALPGRYPLFNADFVKKASEYFTTYFSNFDPESRHIFAKNTLEKAAEFGFKLEEKQEQLMQKVAGVDYGNKVDSQLKMRSGIVDGIFILEEKLSKVASAKQSLPADKFALLLQAFDKEAGVDKMYGDNILDAFEATFDKDLSKEGAHPIWSDESTGLSLSMKELEKVAHNKSDKIKSYFGETLSNSLKKHSHDIFQSLPSDAKIVIARIAKGSL